MMSRIAILDRWITSRRIQGLKTFKALGLLRVYAWEQDGFSFYFHFSNLSNFRTSKLSENSFPVTASIFFTTFILDDWRTSEYAYKDGRLIFRVRTRLNTIKRYLLSKFSICGSPCVCFEFLALGLITSSCRSWFLTLFLRRLSQISRELPL